LKEGKSATGDEIVKFMDQKVSRTKRITGGVEFVESLAKSPSGKILRRLLRDQEKEARRKNDAKL